MVDKINEQLSALLDDECTAVEVPLLLRRLAQDAELGACWQRYQIIGDTLKNNLPAVINTRFCEQIARTIAAEQALTPPLAQRPWRRPLVGVAAAAVLGAVALGITAWQYNAPGTVPNKNNLAVTSPAVSMEMARVRSLTAAVTPTAPMVLVPDRTRLDDYLANHNELIAATNVHGVLPYMHMLTGASGR